MKISKIKLGKELKLNKEKITKLQESQMSSLKGGIRSGLTCNNASCVQSCNRESCTKSDII